MKIFAKTLVDRNLSFLIKSSDVLYNYTKKKNREFGFKDYGNDLIKIKEKIEKDLRVTKDEISIIDKFINLISDFEFNKIYFIKNNYAKKFKQCWELLNTLAITHPNIIADMIYNTPAKKINADPTLQNLKNIKIL